ncbi:M20/M25/M40 family metallo-hydrolase [Pontiella sp.]|uniref:M20/M25/M40 family metallo-hydrolase n=1 Tax=Pontiella sp. TaxID=2837462 RepID=UPI0035619353
MSLTSSELKVLKEVVSLPTAPFCESAVQDYVWRWAGENGIAIKRDGHGNMLLTYPGKGRQSGKPWVLQAHMDHPGFAFIKRRGRQAQAWFRGGVLPEFFPEARMRFFPVDGEPVGGTVRTARRDKESGFLRCAVELDAPAALAEGTLGMWDLPAWSRKGARLGLRVADDLAGVAVILLTLDRLKRQGAARSCHGLLTRAEEVGFIGAISAAQNKTIDPSWPVLGIECSKEQPSAKLGNGAVVRVGDRSTIFDPALTAHLRETARELAPLAFSESLMPGGSTESTGLALMGHRTCAVCLPLGNYHNMGPKAIAPEQIHLGDVESLLALLAHVVQRAPDDAPVRALKKRVLARHANLKELL